MEAPDEEAGLSLPEGERILEVTLISAQGLKPPSGLRRRLLQPYAVAWVDAAHRLQTPPDRAGGVDPEWHERLLFRVHEAALADDSRAAVTVEIYAAPTGGWHIGGDSLVGSARFLLGDHCLLSRPIGSPSMFAVGVRRPSGRVHGLLNLAASLVAAPPSPAASLALRSSPAVSLSALSTAPIPAGRVLRVLNRSFATPPQSPTVLTPKKQQIAAKPSKKGADKQDVAAKLDNNGADDGSDEEREESREMGGVVFCGPCVLPLPRKIHISPSDENLQAFASIFSGGVGIIKRSPRH
uniref:C2 domain-containing protein n=1 Tax=Leersia perrieri TaxID=77586 RepID=A0A0D9V3R3_9ORYZ